MAEPVAVGKALVVALVVPGEAARSRTRTDHASNPTPHAAAAGGTHSPVPVTVLVDVLEYVAEDVLDDVAVAVAEDVLEDVEVALLVDDALHVLVAVLLLVDVGAAYILMALLLVSAM